MRSISKKHPPLWPRCILRALSGFRPRSGTLKRLLSSLRSWLLNHRGHREGTESTENEQQELRVSLAPLRLCVRKAILSIAPILLIVLSAKTQELPSDTSIQGKGPLLEHLERAAKEDPGLIAAFKHYHSALQKVPQVSSLPDPELALGYFISPVETRVGPQRANFSVSQMFPWFGTLDKKKEAAALKAKAEYAEFRTKRAKLYKKVRNTWYELYYKKAHIRSVDSSLRTLRSMEQISESRFRTGQRSMADHLRIRMRRREMEEQLSSLKDELRPLKTRFNTFTGRNADQELEGPERIPKLSLPIEEREDLEDSVLARDPKLMKLQRLEAVSEEQKAVARSEGMPSFGVGLNYTMVGERKAMNIPDNGKDVLMPMLRIKLPIYRKKEQAAIKEADLKRESSVHAQAQRKEELLTTIEESYTDFADAKRRIALYEAQIRDARQARNILLDAFRTGAADVNELLELQQDVYEYRLKLERARADRSKTVARFKKMLAR